MKAEYLQAAQDACDHTYLICPLGSANRPNGKCKESAYSALIKAKSNFSKQVGTILSNNSHTLPHRHFKIIQLLAQIAKEAQAGNCQEMAAVAFLFLLEKKILPLEIVNTPNHTFVVLGRDPATPIHDPELWNEEALICDPWNRQATGFRSGLFEQDTTSSMVYPPKILKETLKDAYHQIQIGFSTIDEPSCLAQTPSFS
jgi:hypothetical protein